MKKRDFKKDFIRIKLYMKVFFVVLGRRLSSKTKLRMVKVFCCCMLLVTMLMGSVTQKHAEPMLQKAVTKQFVIDQNRAVTNKDQTASVTLTRSAVTTAQKEGGDSQTGSNEVVKNPTPLSVVEGSYINNGTVLQEKARITSYQFPIEIGTPIEANYDRKQSPEDFVLREVRETVPEEDASFIESLGQAEPSVSENTIEEEAPADIDDNQKEDRDVAALEEESVSENTLQEDASVSDNSLPEQENAPVVDASYYVVQGTLSEEGSIFLSDITITPTGIDGYSQIRLGEEGDFSSSVVLTQEGMNQNVTLYFTDGKIVTQGLVFTYAKDTQVPILLQDEENFTLLESQQQKIYCTNEKGLSVFVQDPDEMAEIAYTYGDKAKYIVSNFAEAKPEISEEFYGRVKVSGKDMAGNISETLTGYYLVEQNAPIVEFTEDKLCSAPYSLWVRVAEEGHIVSGIQEISCKVNGEVYELPELSTQELTELYQDIQVSTAYEFPVQLEKPGSYEVELQVRDYAGNITTQSRILEVSEPALVSILMPQQFAIHIDPQMLLGKEQIFSDDITLQNNSDCDVKVTIQNIHLSVKDGMADNGVKKDCDVYLIAPDTGERIFLQKGDNENVYSYRLPMGASEVEATLRFVGETTEGSESMWEDADIGIGMDLNFEKWQDE